MTFDDDWNEVREEREYFDAAEAQGHLLIVRAFDAPKYFRSENNPDGMVHPGRGKSFAPFPNTVVRCAIADVNTGKIYPEAILFPFSITKTAKVWVGKGPQLVMWRKSGNKQTDPYELRNMRDNEGAVADGKAFLADHPEFMALPAPDAYDERPPTPERSYEDRGDNRDRGYDRGREFRDRAGDNWDRQDRGRDWDEGPRPPRQESRGYRDERDRAYDPRYSDRGREDRPQRSGRDGSFLSRSSNHQGGFQDDEPPF